MTEGEEHVRCEHVRCEIRLADGRAEEIAVEPAIVSVLSLLRVWDAVSIVWGPECWRYVTCRTGGLDTWASFDTWALL